MRLWWSYMLVSEPCGPRPSVPLSSPSFKNDLIISESFICDTLICFVLACSGFCCVSFWLLSLFQSDSMRAVRPLYLGRVYNNKRKLLPQSCRTSFVTGGCSWGACTGLAKQTAVNHVVRLLINCLLPDSNTTRIFLQWFSFIRTEPPADGLRLLGHISNKSVIRQNNVLLKSVFLNLIVLQMWITLLLLSFSSWPMFLFTVALGFLLAKHPHDCPHISHQVTFSIWRDSLTLRPDCLFLLSLTWLIFVKTF